MRKVCNRLKRFAVAAIVIIPEIDKNCTDLKIYINETS